jgi:bifunctional DNA-binding transcriptional regulator/antitoxin component of YhaV-PrlF toxin-antitoxin module
MAHHRAIDESGRVQIPSTVLDKLGVEPGAAVSIAIDEDRIVVTPAISRETFVEDMRGVIDEESAKRQPADPRQSKRIWTEDLPDEP